MGDQENDALTILSVVLGWTYFACWSSSFYGQVYETYKVKSVAGLAFDYLALNLTGFTFLSIYSTAKYFEDAQKYGIKIEDLAFAYNAVFATLVTIGQVFYYYDTRKDNKVRPWCITFLILLWGTAASYTIYIIVNGQPEDSNLSLWSILGYEKVSISFFKYIPQVYLNYSNKSTVGWSIYNVLMDFFGGFFSFMQIIVDALNKQNISLFDGSLNIVKFILSLESMAFDIIFLTQHYILYSNSHKAKDVQQSLLKPTYVSPIQ